MFIHHDSPKEHIYISCYSFDVGTLGIVLKRCFRLNTQILVVFEEELLGTSFSHIRASILQLSFLPLAVFLPCVPCYSPL